MLPEIMNSRDGGISVLNRMGVDKKFMGDMYNKFGSYASKIPGLNKDMVGNTLNAIEKAMDKPASAQSTRKTTFDSSKYPKL